MIPDQRLSQWVDDPDRYRTSEAAINAFADAWNHGPSNRRIAEAMAEVSNRDSEQVVDALRRLFEDDDWVTSLIDSLAEAMRRDPYFVPPFRHINSDVHQGLIVYEDELVSIAVGISAAAQLAAKKHIVRGSTSIGFSGQIGVLKFVKSGRARLAFWEAPPIALDFSRATAGSCSKAGERDVVEGEIMVIDGRRQSFVIEHAKSNILLLQATVKPDQAPLSVEYDSSSHQFVGCSAADDSASRIQMIASLLGKLDCVEAFPVVAAFLDNPNFYVRWHVMRELLGLDAAAALPHLVEMADRDPHPENQRAARTVLGTLQSDRSSLSKAA